MKFSQKKTCNGCKADGIDCELGYNRIHIPYVGRVPQEPCWKPLTGLDWARATAKGKEHLYK
jgi:hypothetical protein